MNPTKLSVNINKWATLRNARGGNRPHLIDTAKKMQTYGAQGITVHPRPDERHITYQDVRDLRPIVHTEFNIEGYPEQKFIDLVLENKPEQVTLVPDPPGALTSSFGWDTHAHFKQLQEVVKIFNDQGIRVSIFLDPNPGMLEPLKDIGAQRIELYTETYAQAYHTAQREQVTEQFAATAEQAIKMGLGVNAGHDLDLNNLHYFLQNVPQVLEVSIGHALICDSIEMGMQNTVQMYKARCQPNYSR
jgi:pyridoxine 5-phosphate synthase